MGRRGSAVFGGILVILGALFLLSNLGLNFLHFGVGDLFRLMARLWPMFLILPGLAFHYSYFKGTRSDPGILVPGGILLILGLAFQFNMFFGGWGITWPLYIFSVAFGLFELYWFGSRDNALLIPISILGGVSLISFSANTLRAIFSFSAGRAVIPAVLIIIGLVLYFRGRKRKY